MEDVLERWVARRPRDLMLLWGADHDSKQYEQRWRGARCPFRRLVGTGAALRG